MIELGFMLRNIITQEIRFDVEKTDDFQNVKSWKVLTVDIADMLIKTYNKNLIVPMTICNIDYFTYIREGFERIDKNVYHFCLLAQKETISKRF